VGFQMGSRDLDHRLKIVFRSSQSCMSAAKLAAEKGPHSFCHSERSEESLFLFMRLNLREIPRSARNDKRNYLFCIPYGTAEQVTEKAG
jgi:hypothetical protein